MDRFHTEFKCNKCGKSEIVEFSEEQLDAIYNRRETQTPIQVLLPEDKYSSMVRESFISGICLCEKCWSDYWSLPEY